MGKYNSISRRESNKKDPQQLPPIWRGIGFAMMIIIPIMSYAGMRVVMDYNQAHNYALFQIPLDLINHKLGGDPYLFIEIGLTLFLMLVLYACLMMFTFVLNRIFIPSQLGPFDVPRVAYKHRKRP
jgi:hypothetical protein